MKFRILYEVVEELRCRTEESALEALDARSDDIDEYAAEACSNTRTHVARLQRYDQFQDPNNEGELTGSWTTIKTLK